MLNRGNSVVVVLCALVVLGGGVAVAVPKDTHAFDLAALREKLEQKRAEGRSRIDDLHQDSPNTSQSSELNDGGVPNQDNESTENACTCSAKVKLAAPDVRWRGNVLEFTPKFDIDVRVKGEEGALPWGLQLQYGGQAHNTEFNGGKSFGGQCYDGRYKYGGLSGASVPMADITRSLFTGTEELETAIKIHTDITGCDVDSDARQAKLTVEDLGNVKARGWRTWR